MKKLIILSLILVNLAFAAIPDIVALVNDEPITRYDFESRKKMLSVFNNVDTSNAAINASLNKATVNMLIEEELIRQYAKNHGLKIVPEQINAAMGTIENQNGMPKNSMPSYLRERNITLETFQKYLAGEIAKSNILNSLSGRVSVSPSELEVAVSHTSSPEFNIEAWVFTSKGNDENSRRNMQNLRKKISGCDKIEQKLYENYATAEKITGSSTTVSSVTKSTIQDSKIDRPSAVYHDEDRYKMILVCKKDADISKENMQKLKLYLTNKKLSKEATKLFKSLRNKASVKILIPS